jgi:hypothetical protein
MDVVRMNAEALQGPVISANDQFARGGSVPREQMNTISSPAGAPDSVVKDAASILEFLAWGRKMHPDYNSQLSPEASAHAGPDAGEVGDAQQSSFPDILDEMSQIGHLQLLLPGRRQLWELVRYHEECLLWYHCSYFPPSFKKQMEVFFDRFQGVVESGVNLQWLGLLFAVITGSITCAPDHVAQAWGFRAAERETLSRRWCRAVYTCLNAADYAAKQSILSVQALSTMTISVHILGYSNMHSVHLAAAIRIAQGLGLHRLSDESPGTVVDKESGRRLWNQLCCQDWFSIPFSDTYLIHPLYSQSLPPLNSHDDDMKPLPEAVPTSTTYCRILGRIAAIMPQLQDDLVACNTPFTKYEQIVKWDKRMRALSTHERPFFLTPNIPIDPSWPPYIAWARRSLAVTSAHKIIMIHRSFLSESFTNQAFSFTRRTCLAASKTIIKEVKIATSENEPNFWVYQAFTVAASIIFILDMLHRSPEDVEYIEHKQLAEDALAILQQFRNSMIASRGVKLLSALLEEISLVTQTYNSRKRARDEEHTGGAHTARPGFNVLAFVKSFSSGRKQSRDSIPQPQSQNGGNRQIGAYSNTAEPTLLGEEMQSVLPAAFDAFSGQDAEYDASFFPQGLDTTTPFENLLFLANHDFSFFGA